MRSRKGKRRRSRDLREGIEGGVGREGVEGGLGRVKEGGVE